MQGRSSVESFFSWYSTKKNCALCRHRPIERPDAVKKATRDRILVLVRDYGNVEFLIGLLDMDKTTVKAAGAITQKREKAVY